MKKFFIFFGITFCVFSLFGFQNPICQIKDFTPTIKGISFGPPSASVEHCYFWFNSPGAGQVQIACYSLFNQIIYNSIQTPITGISGSFAFSDGTISWLISPGKFHFVGASSIDNIEVHEDGTF